MAEKQTKKTFATVDGLAYYAQTIRKSQAIKVKQKLTRPPMAVPAMDGPAGPALDAIWQKDVHEPGKAHLPQVRLASQLRDCGGNNLVKKHLDKEICKDTKGSRTRSCAKTDPSKRSPRKRWLQLPHS
ncbi:hypothetical protein B0H14DRAFT_2595722 [Mycena olivaceomarginata]|nr:hypothetical protein B0H14DRAFT_2595722 [Mycena olivaceomarginata]